MSKFSIFWEWFQSKSKDIYLNLETNTEDIAFEVTENVKKVHPEIEFEIPFDFEEGKRVLIISADGDESLFDFVEEFVNSAPKISNWNIVAFRPRLHQKNQIIDLDGITMDYYDIMFKYEIINNRLKLDAFIRNYDKLDNRYVHLYFLLLDSLIGEYDSVKMIQETKIYPLKEEDNLHSFKELLDIVDTLKKKEGLL